MTFESWVSQFWPPSEWFMDDDYIQRWRVAYEALDRAAREECAEICDHLSTRAGTADECADAIRGTIK
jgi:hypothetical protein